MSNYTPVNDFSAKDALTTGDPEKIILGSDMDNETAAIQTAVNSKYDSSTTSISLTSLTVTSAVTFTGATITGGAYTGITTLAMTGALTYGGVTLTAAVTGTGKMVLDTAPTISGTLTAGTFSGSGASLTNLTAANVTGSHTLPDGVLSTNVPLLNAANAFTAAQTLSAAGTFTGLTIAATDAHSAAALFKTNGSSRGYFGAIGSSAEFVAAGVAGDIFARAESGAFLFSGDGGTTTHLKISSSGVVTTPNADPAEVGYKGIPQSIQSANYTTVLADANKAVMLTKNGAQSATIDDSVGYPIGTTIMFVNQNAGSAADTVAITTGQAYLAGTGYATSGTRNLAYGGVATYYKYASLSWLCWGVGLT